MGDLRFVEYGCLELSPGATASHAQRKEHVVGNVRLGGQEIVDGDLEKREKQTVGTPKLSNM